MNPPLSPPVAALSDLSDPSPTATLPKLSVFLFEVLEEPTSRNLPPVRQTVPDPNDPTKSKVVVKKPPMALQLNYLFTPWTKDFQTDQQILGLLLQLFYDDAIISGPDLRGGLVGSANALKISMHQITLEDRTRIWHAATPLSDLAVLWRSRGEPRPRARRRTGWPSP